MSDSTTLHDISVRSSFFTNQESDKLYDKFKGILEDKKDIQCFDALIGYFRASGYFKVRQLLKDVPNIRILVGINVDKLIYEYHKKGKEFIGSAQDIKAQFVEEVREDVADADYDADIEEGVKQFVQDILDEKIQIKASGDQKLHAKIYIFRPDQEHFSEHNSGQVVTGSSNLTDAGLGTTNTSNYEFNVALNDYPDVAFATNEFERLWENAVDILTPQADSIINTTHLRDDLSPFEIYIKMLIEYFGYRVEYDSYNIAPLLPENYYRLEYQTDAASQGYAIMMKHNGFILADVVGLGKTIIACLVTKKFINENGTHSRILVVTPPAIKSNWQRTTEQFHIKHHFDFVTTGSLHKVRHEQTYDLSTPEHYDMVIIDESHKFRNDYTDRYEELQEICKTPRIRPAENGDTRKKVILLSATPLNNRPQDIENQLYLFQDRRNSTLENVNGNLQEYFKPINEKYKKLAEEPELNSEKLKGLFEKLRNDVIEPLVIRRTRTDIENEDKYIDDLNEQGITIPKVDDPIHLNYELDEKLTELFHKTVSYITGLDEDGNEVDSSEKLGFYRYRAIEFLANEEDRKIYGDVGNISARLAAIMKTLLVKRLESSFYAFKNSIKRLRKAIENLEEMFENDRVLIAPDLNINKLIDDECTYEQILEKMNEKGGNNKEFSASAFDDDFWNYLKEDKRKVLEIENEWDKVTHDPKLELFADKMQEEFFDKQINKNGKLIIFTESKDTADELFKKLTENRYEKILRVSSDNRDERIEKKIRSNFDANLNDSEKDDQYDILITTEVLAEGINLNRSNVVLNYDVPWNSTRLMQRIGRVNRIAPSEVVADQIFIYNFYPSSQGDQKIRLVNTALRKLQAFHTAFGEDNKIFSIVEEVGEGALYGNKIPKEENEISNYLVFLRKFKRNNEKWFKDIAALPDKVRCGRKTKSVPEDKRPVCNDDSKGKYGIDQTTIVYLKAENHPGIFTLITPEQNVIELNFLEAARLFEAVRKEKNIDLHELHHAQIQQALGYFKSEKVQSEMGGHTKSELSPAENRAITNLSHAIKLAPTEQKGNALHRAKDSIINGTYKKLPKEINQFFKTYHSDLQKNQDRFFEQLFAKVIDQYEFSTGDDAPDKSQQNGQMPALINPSVKISQSFS